MIRESLKVFADGSTQIGKATQNLLGELNLNFQYEQTDEAMDFATMYRGVTGQQVPQNLQAVLDSVEATYLVGFMTHKSLQELNKEHNDSTQLVGDFLCFAVDVKPGITLSRSKAATLVRGFNRIASANPVLLIIRQSDTISLALCERTEYTQQWREGKKLGKVRILMGINCLKPHRGHIDMLERLANHSYTDHEQVYEHWLKVFSVSNLTDLFYTELQNWYFWAVRVAKFPNDVSRTDDYQKYNDEALIRLITRLIFVWFLKEKGLINADLFDEGKLVGILKDFKPQATDNGAYYNAILQNLFFATLNQEIGNRGFVNDNFNLSKDQHNIKTYYRGKELFNTDNEDDIKALFASTPYVNGSLFECLDDRTVDGVTYHYDGFSNKPAFKDGTIRRAFIPNRLFFAPEKSENLDMRAEYGKDSTYIVTVSGLIDILNRYHFTIEENTPSEEQIALDPELLGRTFENLLGAFNPETKQSARKATGSYYTPREIVDYMVEQSLKAYFTTKCPNVAEDDIASLLDDSETMKPEKINDEATEALMQAIYSCNILDPACGSGAFPMGILQRLVIALRKLDADNSHWGEIIKGQAMKEIDQALEKDDKEEREKRLTAIEESFTRQKEHPDFARKLYVIESCIHGVDIQPIAIQISKLRFFISLLCDQKTDSDPADNYGILTLPNLETNLVAANSLVALKKGEQRSLFENPNIEPTKAELTEVRHQLFSARTVTAKRKLRKRDKELRTSLAALLQADGFFAPEDALQLAAWDPYDQNASSPFFDPEWMFGIKDGFDIVIGNPPYMQIKKGVYSRDVFPYSEGKDTGKQNLYKVFIEHGYNICAYNGVVCMIVQESLMGDVSATATRELLLKKCKIKEFIHFPKDSDDPELRVFKNVITGTCIVQFIKEENENKIFRVSIHNNLKTIKAPCFTLLSQENVIKGGRKLEIPLLKEGEGELYTLLKTGYRQLSKILIDTKQGNINTIHLGEIRSEMPTSIRIGKGDKVHRYHLDVQNMMYAKENNYVKELADENTNGYLVVTQNITGTTDSWRIHACRAECKKTNIVFLDSTNLIYLSSPREAALVVGILNSKLLDWIFRTTSTNNHVNMYELVALPIPSKEMFASQTAEELINYVERAEAWEDVQNEIDYLVYKLYGLNYDEVLLVDPETQITENKYNQTNNKINTNNII